MAMLGTFGMLDESSRLSAAYTDSRYAPFYYHLGQELPCRSLLEIGFGIGIASGCYVRGCKTVEHILSFQKSGKNYYSPRLGIHNVKYYFKGEHKVHVGRVTDLGFSEKLSARKWELAILNEEADYDALTTYLDLFWDYVAESGTIVVEYATSNDTVSRAYGDFCLRRGRPKRILPTKYGVGVITRR